MFKLTKLVTFAEGTPEAERTGMMERLRSAGRAAARQLVAPTLPGVFEGGDIVAHYQLGDEAARTALDRSLAAVLETPAVAHVDSAAYAAIAGNSAAPALAGGVYRTLFLAIDRPASDATIAQFESEMQMMPHYIPAIRNWQLSRVSEAGGARRWTHVWEQEYESIAGLMGPYMLHPYHWARIDRWFDPECTDWIVDTRLCHSFCDLERSVI